MKIGRRAILGVLWSTGGKFAGFGVNFAGQLVLVRFLFPRDFGIYALVLSFFQVISVVIDGNFPIATIQMQEEQDLGNTAFVLCLAQGAVILLLSVILAFAIRFYPSSAKELPWLFAILGVRYAISPLVELYGAQLEKNFHYRSLTAVNAVSGVLSTGVGVLCALDGWGVWSLVAREFSSVLILLVGYRIASGKKFRFEFKKTAALKFFHFGRKMLCASGLLALFDRMDNFLVGAFLGVTTVGFYSQARYLSELVHSSIHAVNIVSFPLYSNLKRDREMLGKSYHTLNFFLIRVMYPFTILFTLFPIEIVTFLFGEKWRPTGIALRSLALYPVLMPVGTNLQFVLWGRGEIGITAWARASQIVCGAGLMSLGAWFYGLGGAAFGFMITIAIGVVVMQTWSQRHYLLKGLWENLYLPTAAAAVSIFMVFMLKARVFQNPNLGKLIGLGALAVAIYVVLLIAFERRTLRVQIKGILFRLRPDRQE